MKRAGRCARFLVVRPGALGDTILCLPLLGSILSMQQCAVTFLGTRSYRDLMPRGVEFHAVDHPKWLWLFGDRGPMSLPDLPKFDRAYLVLQHPDRVTVNLSAAGVHDVRSVTSRPPEGVHLVEHVHRGLGLPVPAPEPSLTHLRTGESQDLIWIHPGSGGPRKCVPLAFTAELAQILRDRTGWDVVVTASEADSFLTESPEWHSMVSRPRTHLLENRPILELCRELGGARIFVGNDSGISHLAAGLGIACAIFFVTTDPVQWAPWVPSAQLLVMSGSHGAWRALESAVRIEGRFFASNENGKKLK